MTGLHLYACSGDIVYVHVPSVCTVVYLPHYPNKKRNKIDSRQWSWRQESAECINYEYG